MDALEIVRTGNALAEARLAGRMVDGSINLRSLRSLDEAAEVQLIADYAYGGQPVGYSLAGTCRATASILHCDEPIVSRMCDETIIRSGDTLAVSASMLGVGAELVFEFGRSYPQNNSELVDLTTLSSAIVSCRIGLQIMARRVPHTTLLNPWIATADFGLADAQVQGERIDAWQDRLLAPWPVQLLVDGNVAAEGATNECMGHPLAPLLWLCKRRGAGCIEAGDFVAVGSCTRMIQLVPGHVVEGNFGELGRVTVRLQ